MSIENPGSDAPVCIVCEHPAVGIGPYSDKHMCQKHMEIDTKNVIDLEREVLSQLLPYTNVDRVALFEQNQQELEHQLREIERRFAEMKHLLKGWKTLRLDRVNAQQLAVQKCLRDYEDLLDYNNEVKEALREGKFSEVRKLAHSMQASMPDLRRDFEIAESLCRTETDYTGLRRLRDLQHAVSIAAAAGSMDCLSHEIKLDDMVNWVAVYTGNTSKFRAEPSGLVLPVGLASGDSQPVPAPCLVAAAVRDRDHLIALSLDGTARLHIKSSSINWQSYIWGLHCDGDRVFIAQDALVTVTDISGRLIAQILPLTAGLFSIKGIGGNSDYLLVSGGNAIVVFRKDNLVQERVIRLNRLPDANFYNMAIYRNVILVIDRKNNQVHRVSFDASALRYVLLSFELSDTYPKEGSGIERYDWPRDVAVDSRGRLLVTECAGHTVRAVAIGDGSLLWTLGVPGESGSLPGLLYGPSGLAVVAGDTCERLVVCDCWNKRLLVLNLH